MAQQTLGDLLVKLGLDTSSFQTAVAQVTTRVQALQAQFVGMGTATTAAIAPLGSSMEGLSTHLKSTAGAFGAGASFATAISAFGEIGKAAADAEKGQVRLRTAVEATGATWSGYATQLQTAIEASKNFGFSQADAAESLSLLVAQTGNTEEAMRRQKLAMDLARGANLDLVTASRLVGKITDENITALNRMGFAVAKNSTEQEALASIQTASRARPRRSRRRSWRQRSGSRTRGSMRSAVSGPQ